MKPRKTWLHTAVRAHQAKTLDQLQRTRQAMEELFKAEQLRHSAVGDLQSLSRDWAIQRHAAPSGREIDAVYRRFHGFLCSEASRAEAAQKTCREQVDVAVAELKQSHAMQRTLEKVAKQTTEQERCSARSNELLSNAQAWLLGWIASGSAQTSGAATGDSVDAVDSETQRAFFRKV